jgi:hypothetical protein
MSNKLDLLLHPVDQRAIRSAVEDAERRTSVEINVHVETTSRYPEARALALFRRLKTMRAGRRIGVLMYLLVQERRCFLVVDEPVRALEGTRVWSDVTNRLTIDLLHGKIGQGVSDAITRFSHILAGHYPRHPDDTVEQWDEISTDAWDEISTEHIPPLPMANAMRR